MIVLNLQMYILVWNGGKNKKQPEKYKISAIL